MWVVPPPPPTHLGDCSSTYSGYNDECPHVRIQITRYIYARRKKEEARRKEEARKKVEAENQKKVMVVVIPGFYAKTKYSSYV
jgi:hypothetical protein